jgi:hypothetical protein
MTLNQWAIKHGVTVSALAELRAVMQHETGALTVSDAGGEATAQSLVRLEAARKGVKLFRNNVGVLRDDRGVPIRYGLANDSKQMNETIKSGDLIGIRPTLIEPHMLGWILGQFVSREVKRPGWRYTGTPHEKAQMAWAQLIVANGGDAGFCCGEGTI